MEGSNLFSFLKAVFLPWELETIHLFFVRTSEGFAVLLIVAACFLP